MTNEQIFKQAIEKAIKNGWKGIPDDNVDEFIRTVYREIPLYAMRGVLYNPSFAKAFWGEKPILIQSVVDFTHGTGEEFPAWKAHLIWMVQKKEPLKYLEKYL